MEHGMDRIASLDAYRKDKFRGPVVRLCEAQRKQSCLYHDHPAQRDMFPEYDAIAAWGTVTACYSGIEQAMKCLLQMRDAYIEKKHKHHKIGKLFHELAGEEQDVLHDSYRIYRSLHDYISLETVASFLDSIDAGYTRKPGSSPETGYTTWRYFLLDGHMPPTTHPGAMLEIWSALCSMLSARVFTNHGLYSVEKRIAHNLRNAGQEAWAAWIDMGIGRREMEDIRRWRQKSHYKAIINAYIDLFYQHAERNLDLIEAVPSTKQILNTMVGIVKGSWVDNDFAYFLRRAQMGDIIWKPDTRVFEKTARAAQIEIALIESEHVDVSEFFLDPSVKAALIESAPDYIADFIFAPRFESERVDDDWSNEEEEWKASMEDYGQRIEEIKEFEGGSKCEGYRCNINRIELIIVLYDSKEWIVYRYENNDVPGIPYHCKRIRGNVRSIREAIKTIEQWRRTEKEEFELLRTTVWNRRGKRRNSAQRLEGTEPMNKPKREFVLPSNLEGEAADGYREGYQNRLEGKAHNDQGRGGAYAAGYAQGYIAAGEDQEEDDDWTG